jgi:isoleucyl-tRNA synthetase
MEKKEKNNYKETLNLPRTDFPMRANLAQKERELLNFWREGRIYEKGLVLFEKARRYILHDGPPYANGHIHIGHALNKILKDFVVRSKRMEGLASPYVPGWDCHGLPIEHQVLKNLGPKKQGMEKAEIRRLCREYAERFVEIQREEFIRLGVFGDWQNPYLTMTPDYEAAIVREFGKVVAAGAVYKGKKPVLWCPFDETALAEAEVEYADHTSPSIYVKFPLHGGQAESLLDLFGTFGIQDQPLTRQITGRDLSVVIWTTTPWTLVANRAICLHPAFSYVVCIAGNQAYILAKGLLNQFIKETGLDAMTIHVVAEFEGAKLQGWEFHHPWLDRASPIVLGEHVTLDQGTGCVHTAPGHGQEDYEIGQKYGLEVYAPVDAQGRFTQEVTLFAGKTVFDANGPIINLLRDRGRLLKTDTMVHSYPHCWRCKNPVIFRATEQWFISMEKNRLRERALDAIEHEVQWIPKWGKERILGMMENRPDWCISRQRVWGVPIVAFICLGCKAPLFSKEIADHVADRMESEGGSDIWFSKPAGALLPPGTFCPACKGSRFERESDILDVWFESGVSHAAVLKRRSELGWPADLYLEGSDQHRGWFHSALLASLETDGQAPYRSVLTHGFVVDGSGKKMSKSAGNVVSPQEVIQQYGAEILRLWVCATDFREDARISQEILTQWVEAYRKIRNTCRFLLGNLYDFAPAAPLPDEELKEIDRWALHRMQRLIGRVRQAYEAFEFHVIFHALNNFCSVDLSAFYLDILKDRLYTSPARAPGRRAAQKTLYLVADGLTRLMAPILCFTAEEIWRKLPGPREQSVHLAEFPRVEESWVRPDLEKKWEILIAVRQQAAKALEQERGAGRIGSSLEAKVTLVAEPDLYRILKEGFGEEELAADLIVSEVVLESGRQTSGRAVSSGEGGLLGLSEVRVERASGAKCHRCWLYRLDVGEDPEHPMLCARCVSAVRQVDG